MRELKFRVWIKDEERYYDESGKESFLIVPNGIVLYISEEYEEDGEWFTDKTNATDDVVVEQYTGLKDKNGKEIYEGDIVKQTWFNGDDGDIAIIGVVGFNEEASFGIVQTIQRTYEQYSGFYSQREVIGNIHENPELLKGEE